MLLPRWSASVGEVPPRRPASPSLALARLLGDSKRCLPTTEPNPPTQPTEPTHTTRPHQPTQPTSPPRPPIPPAHAAGSTERGGVVVGLPGGPALQGRVASLGHDVAASRCLRAAPSLIALQAAGRDVIARCSAQRTGSALHRAASAARAARPARRRSPFCGGCSTVVAAPGGARGVMSEACPRPRGCRLRRAWGRCCCRLPWPCRPWWQWRKGGRPRPHRPSMCCARLSPILGGRPILGSPIHGRHRAWLRQWKHDACASRCPRR